MATFVQRRPIAVLERSLAAVRVRPLVGLAALLGLSVGIRTMALGVPFWIDEGLSVGIASHPITAIPHVLRQDGSPPLYYFLLHLWMAAFGSSESATHVLSLLFALAAIPVAWWAGTSLFGDREGWVLAGMTALCPFLTQYAQETRMYSLVVLLGTATTAFFLHAYLFGRQRFRIPFGIGLAAMLYTHNWTFFYLAGLAVALAVAWWAAEDRRRLTRDAAVGFGVAGVLYVPWLPTLIFQVRHTGAPWAVAPDFYGLVHAPDILLGGQTGTILIILIGGAGLVTLAGRSWRDRHVLMPGMLAMALVPIFAAWLSSQASPAWAPRYLAVAVAPLLLLGAIGLTRAGRLGGAALIVLTIMWVTNLAPYTKSNVKFVAQTFSSQLHRGDLVVSTAPEQVPVLHYYLPPGLQWANPFGRVPDTGVVDWIDGPAHFDRSSIDRDLLPLLQHLRRGQRVLLVNPIVTPARYQAPWSHRVWRRALEYEGVMRGDPALRLVDIFPMRHPGGPNPLQGLLFVKTRSG